MAGLMGTYTYIWSDTPATEIAPDVTDVTHQAGDILDPSELFDDDDDVNHLLSEADHDVSEKDESAISLDMQNAAVSVILTDDIESSCSIITDKVLLDYQLMCSVASYRGP